MGYNVNLRSAHFHVPETESVLQVLKDLNKNDHLKQGGSYGGGRKTESWFSWMPADYDKTVTSVKDVFELLGFDCSYVEEPWGVSVSLNAYDAKTGQEDLFCAAVAPFMDKGSYIEWIGEDYAEEAWVVQDGQMKVLVREASEKWWQ